jgi:uncharacterized protein
MNINQTIAKELNVNLAQVEATVALLAEGATVPFIARYRKEVTGGLDDTQLRSLHERLGYLQELEDRRTTVLNSIEEQGKLTTELKNEILAADNKARLEDLYLPYKPKRRTKAQIAREAGLEPLADALLNDPNLVPEIEAQQYLNPEKEINDAVAALDGARQILMERFAEDADLLQKLRDYSVSHSFLTSKVVKDKNTEGSKFADYFDYQEALQRVPSHRALAVFRGQNEGFLRVGIEFLNEQDTTDCLAMIGQCFGVKNTKRAADSWLWETVEWCWKIKLSLKIELDLLNKLRENAEEQAIKVFQDNLKNLLMAAPAGHRVTMGLDPGLRTGVKVVVVDDTGKLLAHHVIFPHLPRQEWDKSLLELAKLCQHYKVNLVSIGNGTASRETEKLVVELNKKFPELKLLHMVVSEAGASVYSASALASKEFPDLDVSYRGAVSIARRLQDPLAELVKIDPKAIGVGQYQHDVNQIKLGKSLDAVLEDCVNAVGADVNTASVPLLKVIAGLNETVAKNIVSYRETNGRFKDREAIKKIPRLGDKTFEQAIGFLRVIGGENPLDASAVHPEAYPVVEHIIRKTGKTIQELMADIKIIKTLDAKDFVTEQFGLPTIQDIFAELQKPGRDPRPEFKTVSFKEGVETLKDLKTGMQLDGVVTNVTNFGAFVDIGVHQDGLVHISQLANQFVSDPNQVVKVGQIVKVKVLEVDLTRNRVQLTMKTEVTPNQQQQPRTTQDNRPRTSQQQRQSAPTAKPTTMGSFGAILKDALK